MANADDYFEAEAELERNTHEYDIGTKHMLFARAPDGTERVLAMCGPEGGNGYNWRQREYIMVVLEDNTLMHLIPGKDEQAEYLKITAGVGEIGFEYPDSDAGPQGVHVALDAGTQVIARYPDTMDHREDEVICTIR